MYTSNFNVTSPGTQVWTVPESGIYTIKVAGASGGNSLSGSNANLNANTGDPGMGSIMQANYSLKKGTKLYIEVGQQGLNYNPAYNTEPLPFQGNFGHPSEGGYGGGGKSGVPYWGNLVQINDYKFNAGTTAALWGAGGGGMSRVYYIPDDANSELKIYNHLIIAGGGGGGGGSSYNQGTHNNDAKGGNGQGPWRWHDPSITALFRKP